MKVDIETFDDENTVAVILSEIGPGNLDKIVVESGSKQVWIDTYSQRDATGGRKTTYGWVDVDDAERIANAILLAVQETRQKAQK